jgi:hypothetical protein
MELAVYWPVVRDFRWRQAMFEAEIEMEKRSSSFGPVLFIAVLVLAIAGGIYYAVHESKKSMSETEASQLITSILKTKGPSVLHFRTGLVKQTVDEKPFDPQYKLLEKAGLIKTAKRDGGLQVTLTSAGEKVLSDTKGVTRTKRLEGGESIEVPLAFRKLVAVTKVDVKSPARATVAYTWKWEPTKLGEVFDASNPMVSSFNVWERGSLIKDYGVDFYHAEPKAEQFAFVRGANDGWSIAEAD